MDFSPPCTAGSSIMVDPHSLTVTVLWNHFDQATSGTINYFYLFFQSTLFISLLSYLNWYIWLFFKERLFIKNYLNKLKNTYEKNKSEVHYYMVTIFQLLIFCFLISGLDLCHISVIMFSHLAKKLNKIFPFGFCYLEL